MTIEKSRVYAPQPLTGAGGLRVARLVKAHGLKGGLKLELYTDNPQLRFVKDAVFHLQVPESSAWFGRTLSLKQLHWFNERPVAFFNESANRTDAETLVGAILWIDDATVAAGAETDAWYDQDLTGLEVRIADNTVGKVLRVEHLPAQDLLAVQVGSETVLVPFVKALVPEVNPAQGYIVVTPPAGLFPDTSVPVNN